jgi:hypothetical protein
MKAANPCNDRLEDLVALAMGELDPTYVPVLQAHVDTCQRCRVALHVLVEEEKEVRLGFEALARRLASVERAMPDTGDGWPSPRNVRVVRSNNHFFERTKDMILSHKRLSAAAAVVTTLAAGLIVYLSLFSSPGAAYALEQTVQANKQVTSYHIKVTPAAELGEAWVQLNPDGSPLRARMDLQSPGDGAKVVILSDGKAEVWFKDKKGHTFVPEKEALSRIAELRKMADPKLVFEQLQAAKAAGKVEITSKEPTEEGEPIVLTVTPKDATDRQEIYEVDPQTKLVERMTRYRRQGEQWQQIAVCEYLDYNQPIDPKVFQLDLPEDVLTVDQIARKPGLVKGDLSDEEIATKVAREFFEALIAQDYEKAGLIYSGIPAEKLEEGFGRITFLRIVEIGKPTPHELTKSLRVPVKVEWEMKQDGKSEKQIREFSPFIRPVYGQPDRWEISGGI